MLIPFGIGQIITLIISIKEKQWRIFISYTISSALFLTLIAAIVYVLLTIFGDKSGNTIANTLILLYAIFPFIAIVMLVRLVKSANYWTYNKYINEGYILVNNDHNVIPIFVEKAKTSKKPWWIFWVKNKYFLILVF